MPDSKGTIGYVLVLRPMRNGRIQPMLEPASVAPEELAIIGQSITLEDAILAFGATKEQLAAAYDRAHARGGVGPSA